MDFISAILGSILGCGVGGTIIYLASQKFIENTTEPKFEKLENLINKVGEDSKDLISEVEKGKVSVEVFEEFKNENTRKMQEFKSEYVPLKVYEVSQKYLNESLKEIKDMVRVLTEKFDTWRERSND